MLFITWLDALIESSSGPSIFVLITSIDPVDECWLKADRFERPCNLLLAPPPHRAVTTCAYAILLGCILYLGLVWKRRF